MNVSLRPLEDRDLDTIYQQVTDPESIRMAAFTADDATWDSHRRPSNVRDHHLRNAFRIGRILAPSQASSED